MQGMVAGKRRRGKPREEDIIRLVSDIYSVRNDATASSMQFRKHVWAATF